MPAPAAPASRPPRLDIDHPARWLGSSPVLDLEDPRLRLRERSITQLCKTDREKALAIYAFVKRLPFTRPMKLRMRTAREVLDLGKGASPDKATLLVALLRLAGIPSRLRFIRYRGEVMRGLVPLVFANWRPVLEAWLGGRWVATDTYVFDAVYMAAARHRLKELGWQRGFGIGRDGQGIWNGIEDAWSLGLPPSQDPMTLQDHGCWHDPQAFETSAGFRRKHGLFARRLHWNLVAPWMERAIRRLREDEDPPPSSFRSNVS